MASTVTAALLLVALCSGYWFNTIWLRTRYYSAREAGHRLYFRATFHAIWLVFLTSVALLLTSPYWASTPHTMPLWPPAALFETYIVLMEGRASMMSVLLSFPLAGILGFILNLYYCLPNTRARLLRKVVAKRDLERLVLRATETRHLLQITLDTGKVYVGWVFAMPDPAKDREYLRIMPLMSGHRTSDTHDVLFTIKYTDVVRPLAKSETSDAGLDSFEVNPSFSDDLVPLDFEIVLPAARIVSAHIHDTGVYQRLSGAIVPPSAPGNS